MSGMQRSSTSPKVPAANGRLAEAAHVQAIEGNPLTADEIAMFERDGRSPEQRRAYILRRIEDRGRVVAAE